MKNVDTRQAAAVPVREEGVGSARAIASVLVPAVLLLLTWIVYAPGLPGPFLFDDFNNLYRLSRFGEIGSASELLVALSSGIAGPSGRPLALLSFLINDIGWPSEPYAFKYTNVLLHMLNALLLLWVQLKLLEILGWRGTRRLWVAGLATLLWAVHPLHVSTTLYVVQRMVLMCTSFVLLGMLLYVQGRQVLARGRLLPGYGLMCAGAGLCGLLAVLNKENGALLPLFLIIIEYIVIRASYAPPELRQPPKWFAGFAAPALFLPLLLVVAYLVLNWERFDLIYLLGREFSLGERLLTEPRVLFSYLGALFAPRIQTAGLYREDYPVSHGLFDPVATAIAMAGIVVLLLLALYARRRMPLVSLALLVFLAGHLIESTVIPLELYFEHRNYAPSLFLFLPVVALLVQSLRSVRLRGVILGALALIFAGLCWSRASLWSDELRLATVWAEKNPASPRTHLQAGVAWDQIGRPDMVARQMEAGLRLSPGDSRLLLTRLQSVCPLGGEEKAYWLEQTGAALRDGPFYGHFTYTSIQTLIDRVGDGTCTSLSFGDLEGLIDAALHNTYIQYRAVNIHDLLHLRGVLRLRSGAVDVAALHFLESLKVSSHPEPALLQAGLLADAGHPDLALQHLNAYLQRHQSPAGNMTRNIAQFDFLDAEVRRMRAQLQAEVAGAGR